MPSSWYVTGHKVVTTTFYSYDVSLSNKIFGFRFNFLKPSSLYEIIGNNCLTARYKAHHVSTNTKYRLSNYFLLHSSRYYVTGHNDLTITI
jgi:hypothetical protein